MNGEDSTYMPADQDFAAASAAVCLLEKLSSARDIETLSIAMRNAVPGCLALPGKQGFGRKLNDLDLFLKATSNSCRLVFEDVILALGAYDAHAHMVDIISVATYCTMLAAVLRKLSGQEQQQLREILAGSGKMPNATCQVAPC